MPKTIPKSIYKKPYVNLDDSPSLSKIGYKMDDQAALTVGDIHGNALKLIYIMWKHNYIDGIDDGDYEAFVEIYQKGADKLTKQDIDTFHRLLDKINVPSKGLLRLLGDDLADRGQNDYFTLKIIEKLDKENANFQIAFSNHTSEFIKRYENYGDFKPTGLHPSILRSTLSLNTLIERGLIDKAEVAEIYHNHYLKHLKLISYGLNEKTNTISLHSHAPIGIESIGYLAKAFGVPYKEDSIHDLAQTIEGINKKFYNNYGQKGKIHTLLNDRALDPVNNPVYFTIWNRNYDIINRPQSHNGFNVKYFHGHDSNDPSIEKHIYPLDNQLGKGDIVQGSYSVHFSNETQLNPSVKTSRKAKSSQKGANGSKPSSAIPGWSRYAYYILPPVLTGGAMFFGLPAAIGFAGVSIAAQFAISFGVGLAATYALSYTTGIGWRSSNLSKASKYNNDTFSAEDEINIALKTKKAPGVFSMYNTYKGDINNPYYPNNMTQISQSYKLKH